VPRLDIAAVRAALSDPREVARGLGLSYEVRGPRKVKTPCPVHGGRGKNLEIFVGRDGILMARCWSRAGCVTGDVFKLIRAIDHCDFATALARAAELAGGVSRAPRPVEPEEVIPRLEVAAYDAAAKHLLALGELRERGAVEDYLQRRGLLEAARGDGWAALPSWRALTAEFDADTLLALGLAHRRRDGALRGSWSDNRLVIPWRDDEGRVATIQRRLLRAERPKTRDSKYVSGGGRGSAAPYGVEMLQRRPASPILWVEGALDVLAARPLARGPVVVLGIPGGNGWVTAWRRFASGRWALYGLDADPQKPAWARPGDLFAASIALDCVILDEAEHRRRARAFSDLQARHRSEADAGRDPLALGPLRCVLCGAEAAWLCEGCGRVRPGRGAKDWAERWERRGRK